MRLSLISTLTLSMALAALPALAKDDSFSAIKEAAKEEDVLRGAMEKAQLAIASASEEQKAKYELLQQYVHSHAPTHSYR